MPYNFNNAHCRNHVALFGEAFYDLDLDSDPQRAAADKLKQRLKPGDECVVAAPIIAPRFRRTLSSVGSPIRTVEK